MSQSMKSVFQKVLQNTRIELVGTNDIGNRAHGAAMIALLQAYGDSPTGFLFVEPTIYNSTKRPPDLVLCHPEVGVLVVEVKAYSIDAIERAVAGTLYVRMRGHLKPKSPLAQARGAMFTIKHAYEHLTNGSANQPIFGEMAAFPNISLADWQASGLDQCLPSEQLLFAEHLRDPKLLKQQVSRFMLHLLDDSRLHHLVTETQITHLRRVFGDSATINNTHRVFRPHVDEVTLGSYIDDVEALDKYLSEEQKQISDFNLNGYQRLVRGVAGSGKTVVLASMAAKCINRLFKETRNMFEDPDTQPQVLVLCFNRSLVSLLEDKIRRAYHQQTGEELADGMLFVMHYNQLFWRLKEWGADIQYLRIQDERDPLARADHYQQEIAAWAEHDPEGYTSLLFDAILVDEGQDFLPEDYALLLDLIKPHPATGQKSLAVFYDDAQNLYGRPRPNWSQIGIDVQGKNRSRVMRECFRNTREVVELAFNVLLGTAAPPDVRVQTRGYADMASLLQNDLIEETDAYIQIKFAKRSYEPPTIHPFQSREQEKHWVAQQVAYLVEQESVRPEDILILFPSEYGFEDLPDRIERQLKQASIEGFLQPYGRHEADKERLIFREGYLTLSTIHGAKGYDAPIVFLVGVDLLDTDTMGRAAFYVAATRSKLILNISGKDVPSSLLAEAQAISEITHNSLEQAAG
ncbi:MAG: DNA helicase [Chloroflexota bacterium]|nr:DUF2075 domain-containing protein [Chloroflexota bacterium]NOG62332.1 ATP-binding domain-containing protein [Chloroflexota bacterium]GIK65475.1 MAG: DNA helicase [Chloroflexota bacterium]